MNIVHDKYFCSSSSLFKYVQLCSNVKHQCCFNGAAVAQWLHRSEQQSHLITIYINLIRRLQPPLVEAQEM